MLDGMCCLRLQFLPVTELHRGVETEDEALTFIPFPVKSIDVRKPLIINCVRLRNPGPQAYMRRTLDRWESVFEKTSLLEGISWTAQSERPLISLTVLQCGGMYISFICLLKRPWCLRSLLRSR